MPDVPQLRRCVCIERDILSVMELLSSEAQGMLANIAPDESETVQDVDAIQKYAEEGSAWCIQGLW
jgi:hypothetical protein